jgi:hypothetical protein
MTSCVTALMLLCKKHCVVLATIRNNVYQSEEQ